MKEIAQGKKLNIWRISAILLLVLTVLSAVKTLFVGMDVDEEYAISLAYRLAKGDKLLLQAWEPHQLSGIFPAMFVKLWMLLTGGMEYLVLYLRLVGLALQWATAFAWFMAFRKDFDFKSVFFSSILIANTLPKWIQTPEFANMQIWFLLLALIFIWVYQKTKTTVKNVWLVLSALCVVGMVLAYPSTVIVVLPFLWMLRKKMGDLFLFLGTCVMCAAIFFAIIFRYMDTAQLKETIGYIFADGEHSISLLEKMCGYGKETLGILPYLVIYVACAFLLEKVWKKRSGKSTSMDGVLVLSVVIASLDQLRLWLFCESPNVHPQIRFLLLFLLAVVLYRNMQNTEKKDLCRLILSTSLLSLAAVLLLTNLTVQASFVHLLPGMLLGILLLGEQLKDRERRERFAIWGMLAVFLLVSIFGRIWLVRFEEGRHEDILLTRQKALYGAAKYIYYPYMAGYQYNDDYVFLNSLLERGTKVLYVGQRTLLYTMGDYEVCGASLMSTPVFDQKYVDYMENNDDKEPDAVVIDKAFLAYVDEGDEPLFHWIEERFDWDSAQESEFLYVLLEKNLE